jgi:tryptophan synthase alpha chain
MSRIDDVFKKSGRKALVAYVTVGYPSIEATLEAVPVLARAGCDIIELGIPFSDPLADGATIQKASHLALENGVTPGVCLETAGCLSKKVDAPLVFMTYLNPVMHYGYQRFCQACRQAGVSGLIIPDLPPEEGGGLGEAAGSSGLDLIYMAAPTSTQERIKIIGQRSGGFIYVVSLTGVTGARQSLSADLPSFINSLREVTSKPLCVGFGVSTPEQAAEAANLTDGVIIGSRIIQLMEEDPSLAKLEGFIGEARRALDAK